MSPRDQIAARLHPHLPPSQRYGAPRNRLLVGEEEAKRQVRATRLEPSAYRIGSPRAVKSYFSEWRGDNDAD
jgi:hypothetical protein